jgi:integrase/recombinase XerD
MLTMLVQKGQLPNSNRPIWLVLDDRYQPVEPIMDYLTYLNNLEKSPNTVRTYAYNLKLYWEFLQHKQIDWQDVDERELADFIHWLRNPQPIGVMSIQPQTSNRTEKTINHALNTVSMFYEFHIREHDIREVATHTYKVQPGRRFKPFLHHISKGKEVKTRLLKIKEPKTFPGCLTREQVEHLIEGCHRLRDKFLICLMYETGMRIGEALGMRHEDIRSQGKNEIHVIPRSDNVNSSRAKSGAQRVLHVSKELLKLYSSYLIEEYPEDIDCDYVFVNCWDGKIGQPMQYSSAIGLFRRLKKKTGIEVNPHLLRHTHATEMIRKGIGMEMVQKRLGHASIQTTIDTYTHLSDEDLKTAYNAYLEERDK